MNRTEDGKIVINGLTFNKERWNERPKQIDNPLGGLTYIKKKDELAKRFKRFFMDYKFPKMPEHEKELSYEEERKLSTDFLISLGFVSKDIERWPYTSYTHKLCVADLKDLFVQTFSNDLKEESKKYEASIKELAEYDEDMTNRRKLAKGIEEYIAFKCAFTNRQRAMKNLIESVELSIGQNRLRTLANKKDGYGNYEYIPEENRVNAFEAMEYAKEWLRAFEPVIEELNRLDDVLNLPWNVRETYNEIPDKKLRKMELNNLANFRYQDFLTFLMDFKQRFGNRRDDYHVDKNILTGWVISAYDFKGEYRHGGDATKWNVFDCSKDYYNHRYGTWGQWLNYKALNGEIEALSDPQTLQDIVMRTNLSRHQQNVEYDRYKKPLILVTKSEVKKEGQ